jgi:hypothetical protein
MSYSPVNPWTFPVNPAFPWLPQSRTITSITQANPAVVTTSGNHGYLSGLVCRIFFPFPYANSFGMYQINGLSSVINVLSPTTFSMAINSLSFDPFVVGTALETPQVLPIGQSANGPIPDDFTQVNPVNPANLAQVPIFQKPGLQSGGPCQPT